MLRETEQLSLNRQSGEAEQQRIQRHLIAPGVKEICPRYFLSARTKQIVARNLARKLSLPKIKPILKVSKLGHYF